MKRLLVATTAILLAFTSCEKENLVGSGSTQTEVRTLTGFSKIEVEGSTAVDVLLGADFKVSIKAYSNLLPQLETKVVGDILKIGFKSGVNVTNDNSAATITLPVLSGFYTNGNSLITIKSGNTTNFDATIIGTSIIKAFDYAVQNANIKIEGSGLVELAVANKLQAKITGSGNIYYKGNPTTIKTDITGTGKVEKR
jgi:hypothetical protein